MDIFSTEKEILPLFQDMSHVVIGTVATVTEKTYRTDYVFVTINHFTESSKLILMMNRLKEYICVSMFLQIIKSTQIDVLKAFLGMSFINMVFFGEERMFTKKVKAKASAAKNCS